MKTNKIENNIHTFIELYKDDVEFNLSVKDGLTAQDGNLKNFGYIQITDGSIDTKPIFWDGITFFLSCGKKEFKKECKKELKEKGYNWKEIYTTIKELLNRAVELKILTV